MIGTPAILPVDTVMEPAFAVAVRIDHLFRAVFLCHIRKTTSLFQDAGRRIVQEHDIFPVSIRLRKLKGSPQPGKLAVHQLFSMLLCRFIPACDPATSVQIKRSFKSEALGSDKGVILINLVAVL